MSNVCSVSVGSGRPLLSNKSCTFERGGLTAFKAQGTKNNRKLDWVRLTVKVWERKMLHETAAATHSSNFFWNRWAWNIVSPSWFPWQNFWKGDCKTSLFIPCASSVSFSSAPLCCLHRVFFWYLFLFLFLLFTFQEFCQSLMFW